MAEADPAGRDAQERRPERARSADAGATQRASAEAGATRKVAAFDFDGTITRRDSMGPFLARVCGRWRLYSEMALRSPVLAAVLVGRADRDAEKERLVGRMLRGRGAAVIRDEGARYAQHLHTGDALRPEMLDRLRWHRDEGHEIVIVSASLDAYLDPLAPLLGVEHVLCTRLGVGADGRLDGTLLGGNVRGPEKVRRVQEWLGGATAEIWAYGDSTGDRELLAFADHPVWLGGKAR